MLLFPLPCVKAAFHLHRNHPVLNILNPDKTLRIQHLDHPRKILPRPLRLHLNTIIPVISHPSGNPQRAGNITRPITKSHSLHSTGKPIMLSDQILSHLRILTSPGTTLPPDSSGLLIFTRDLCFSRFPFR